MPTMERSFSMSGVNGLNGPSTGMPQNPFFSHMQPRTYFFPFPEGMRQQEPEQRGCSKEYLNGLPTNKKDGDCVICMDELKTGSGVELPCGHAFDKHCLEKWL